MGFALLFFKAALEARLAAPDPSLLMLDRNGRFLGEVGNDPSGEFGYWPVKELPPRIVSATLLVEDRRFWAHPGLDPLAMVRAVWQNLRHGRRISGASTIAMQIARMQNPGPRTYLRKAQETLTALLLTWRYGRKAVLLHYLRIAPFGNRVRGIAYAARRYLEKPLRDLSWAETAFLIAIPQAPSRMNPYDPEGRWRAIKRGKRILKALRQEGVLPTEEYLLAVEQLEDLFPLSRPRRPEAAMHAILRLDKLLSDTAGGRTPMSSPIVHATLDLDIQEEVAWQTFLALSGWEDSGAGNAAVMVLDNNTQQVLAYIGSTDYFDASHAGAIDYTRVPRSPGSTLKPFLYGLALDRGVITPATILDDLKGRAGGIGNADYRFMGPLLPRVALANSRNVPAAGLLKKLGLDEGFAHLAELGLHDHALPAEHYGLGLAVIAG
jgi:penicillin-binding protein 1C